MLSSISPGHRVGRALLVAALGAGLLVPSVTLGATAAAADPTCSITQVAPYPPAGEVGVPYSAQINVAGGSAPYTFSADSPPAGWSLSSDGVVSGLALQPGVVVFNATVMDSAAPACQAPIVVDIEIDQAGATGLGVIDVLLADVNSLVFSPTVDQLLAELLCGNSATCKI